MLRAFANQRVHNDLFKHCNPILPLSALLYLMKTKGKYPKLASIADISSPNAALRPTECTVEYPITHDDPDRTVTVTCLREDADTLFAAIKHMEKEEEYSKKPENKIYTERIWLPGAFLNPPY